MADLESAAAEALSLLREAEVEMAKAKAEMGEADAEIHRLAQQLASDWSELDTAADALLERARSTRQALEAASQQAARGLAELGQELTDGHQQAVSEARQAASGLLSLEQATRAAAPEAAAMGDAVASQSQAFAAYVAALAAEVEATLAQVQQFFAQDVVASLRTMRGDAHELAQQLRANVFEAAAHGLEAAQAELDKHLNEVDESLGSALEDAAQHVPAVVDYAIAGFKDVHERHAEELLLVAGTLSAALHRLEATIEGHGRAAQTAAAGVTQHCLETEQAAAGATQSLTAVRDLLATYTFAD